MLNVTPTLAARALAIATIAGATVSAAQAGDTRLRVLYLEAPGFPGSVVPGALDANGDPVETGFSQILDLQLAPTGDFWLMRAFTNQPSDENQVLILGFGEEGEAFAQESQPLLGGVPGELYDFFDGVATFNENEQLAFGARAKGGDSATFEKVIRYDLGSDTHTIVAQRGDDALGLIDIPGEITGDEILGNSINAIHITNGGRVGFNAVTIDNVSFMRRPALFYWRPDTGESSSFLQSGIDIIDGEFWDSFDSDDFLTTPDGKNVIAQGDDEGATGSDDIVVFNNQVVVREGEPPVPGELNVDGIFAFSMGALGWWAVRGDFPDDNDWAILNGELIARTGASIIDGSDEVWGDSIAVVHVSPFGEYAVAGNTVTLTGPSGALVINGQEVFARIGDPVDADGDGQGEADLFIRSFAPNDVRIGPGGVIYFICTLTNKAGDNLGDALVRIERGGDCAPTDWNQDGTVNAADVGAFLSDYFADLANGTLVADFDGNGVVNAADVGAFLSLYFKTIGDCF